MTGSAHERLLRRILGDKRDGYQERNHVLDIPVDVEAPRLLRPDQAIGIVEDPQMGCSGPIWIRGGIPIEDADGEPYETRNHVTLCRCGKSGSMPYCDGSHVS